MDETARLKKRDETDAETARLLREIIRATYPQNVTEPQGINPEDTHPPDWHSHSTGQVGTGQDSKSALTADTSASASKTDLRGRSPCSSDDYDHKKGAYMNRHPIGFRNDHQQRSSVEFFKDAVEKDQGARKNKKKSREPNPNWTEPL